MNYVLLALALAGVTIFLIIDNYRLSGEFFQNDDFTDSENLHHEHMEALSFMLMVFFLIMAV
jgi:hypothetical protein